MKHPDPTPTQVRTRCILTIDEMACWLDMLLDTSVIFTGAHSVPLKTIGHDKDHYTVILSAQADGTKMKAYVVFKGKGTCLIKDLQCMLGIVVHFSSCTVSSVSCPLANVCLCGMPNIATQVKYTSRNFPHALPHSNRLPTLYGMYVLRVICAAVTTRGLPIPTVMNTRVEEIKKQLARSLICE